MCGGLSCAKSYVLSLSGLRVRIAGFHRVAALAVCGSLGLLMVGCQTVKGGPERLYTAAEERASARDVTLPDMLDRYYSARNDTERIYFRNEYIARRMYIIDVEYTEYEGALTRERQEFGFATSMVSQGLNTAGAVFTPASTVRILSGLAGGVNAGRGFYDSELLLTKTVQIAQGHMRAQRDRVARTILFQRNRSSVEYPLSAALRDLEDYYRAGTITAGLIEAVGAAGEDAQIAAVDKARAQGIPDADMGRTILITDPGKPIPTVPRSRFAGVNPEGTTDYERKLQPSQIKKLREFACLTSDAKFLDVRAAVVRKLVSLGVRKSDKAEIDEVDVDYANSSVRGKANKCPAAGN